MNSKEVLQSIRAALGFETDVVEFESALLKDGTEVRWNGELAVGTPIMVVTAEGELPAPDATHELEDGTLVTTQNGAVTEIVNPTLVEDPSTNQQMGEEAVVEQAIMDKIVSIVQGASPDLAPDVISAIASQIMAAISELTSESEMGKEMYDKEPIVTNVKDEEMQKEIDALKEGMRKMISVMEQFSAIPEHEPVQKPHAPSKKQSQEEQLMKFSKALNNLKK